MNKNLHKYGVVRTNKIGSDCEFYICSREEWESATEDEREEMTRQALWDSGMVEYYAEEDFRE